MICTNGQANRIAIRDFVQLLSAAPGRLIGRTGVCEGNDKALGHRAGK
jgi:hypothetical protein